MTAAKRFEGAFETLKALVDEGYTIGVPLSQLRLTQTAKVKPEPKPAPKIDPKPVTRAPSVKPATTTPKGDE